MLAFLTALVLVFTGTQEIRNEICSYDWDCTHAIQIATRESNLQPTAINYDCNPLHPYTMVCVGLFGIWTAHCPLCDLMNPSINTYVAYQLYLISGWSPWND